MVSLCISLRRNQAIAHTTETGEANQLSGMFVINQIFSDVHIIEQEDHQLLPIWAGGHVVGLHQEEIHGGRKSILTLRSANNRAEYAETASECIRMNEEVCMLCLIESGGRGTTAPLDHCWVPAHTSVVFTSCCSLLLPKHSLETVLLVLCGNSRVLFCHDRANILRYFCIQTHPLPSYEICYMILPATQMLLERAMVVM